MCNLKWITLDDVAIHLQQFVQSLMELRFKTGCLQKFTGTLIGELR